MEKLKGFRDEAVELIEKSLGAKLGEEERGAIEEAVAAAISKTARHASEHAMDTMLRYPLEDQDKAHKIADEMRRKTDMLIANLSAQR